MNISGKFLKAFCTDYQSKQQLTKNKSKLTASTCTFHLLSQHRPMLHCTLSFQSCCFSAQYNKQSQGYKEVLLSKVEHRRSLQVSVFNDWQLAATTFLSELTNVKPANCWHIKHLHVSTVFRWFESFPLTAGAYACLNQDVACHNSYSLH